MADASQIREHMEVIGADGVHVGTVDHVDGDRIKLTKADQARSSSRARASMRAITTTSRWASSPASKATRCALSANGANRGDLRGRGRRAGVSLSYHEA